MARPVPDRLPASDDLRAYVTKPLLDRITDQAIDSDYKAAAQRRGPVEETTSSAKTPTITVARNPGRRRRLLVVSSTGPRR